MTDQQILELVIGKHKKECINICDTHEYILRILKEDNIYYKMNLDRRLNRINIYLENDIVIKANIG